MIGEESVWKHDSYGSSRVCKKMGVSEGIYVHTTNLARKDRNSAYNLAYQL